MCKLAQISRVHGFFLPLRRRSLCCDKMASQAAAALDCFALLKSRRLIGHFVLVAVVDFLGLLWTTHKKRVCLNIETPHGAQKFLAWV